MNKILLFGLLLLPFFSKAHIYNDFNGLSLEKKITYTRTSVKDSRGRLSDKVTLTWPDGKASTHVLKHNAKVGFIMGGQLFDEKAFKKLLKKSSPLVFFEKDKSDASNIKTDGYDYVFML